MNFSALPNELVAKIQRRSDFKTTVLMRRTSKRMESIVRDCKLDVPKLLSIEFNFNRNPNASCPYFPIHGKSNMILQVQLQDPRGNSRYNKFSKFIPAKYLYWITGNRERIRKTVKKFPCFEKLTVSGAYIDRVFFEDLIEGHVNYSQLQQLTFFLCKFSISPEELTEFLKPFMFVHLDMCDFEVRGNPNLNPWRRYLCYGEDVQKEIGLKNFRNFERIDVIYFTKFLKLVLNKTDLGFTVPNYIKLPREISENIRQKENVLQTLKELENTNNCTVLIEDLPFIAHVRNERLLETYIQPFKTVKIIKRREQNPVPMVVVFHLVFFRRPERNDRDL